MHRTLIRTAERRQGFTLIEMLVTITIAAVLIGLLIPVIGSVRDRARAAVCLKQAQQIAVGVMTFTGDNNGRLPANRTIVAEGEHVTWRTRLADDGYISADACVCPSHPIEPLSELGTFDRDTVCVGDVASSYALNGHLLWREEVSGEQVSRSDAAIRRPSHTILIAETRARFPDLRVIDPLIAADDELGGVFGFWHGGDGVYSFSDGHAETIGMIDTGSPDCRWHSGKDWGEDPYDPQTRAEIKSHDHPDWELLLHPVYLKDQAGA